ncbi:MAG: DUF6804 family protein [Chlorobiaceae bacterium]
MPVQVIYITAALLLIAIFPLNDELYSLVKITAAGTFAWGAYRNFGQKKVLLPLAYTLFTILFNPVVDIHLAKELWIVADLAGAVLLFSTKQHIAQ